MGKELVIVFDTPSTTYTHIISAHYCLYFYLNFFDRVHVLYWSKDGTSETFEKERGKFIFYPYSRPYNSRYITGIKYMIWIGKPFGKFVERFPGKPN